MRVNCNKLRKHFFFSYFDDSFVLAKQQKEYMNNSLYLQQKYTVNQKDLF